MNKKIKLALFIFLYLFSNLIFYCLTYGYDTAFLIYKIVYGVLFFVIIVFSYRSFSTENK